MHVNTVHMATLAKMTKPAVVHPGKILPSELLFSLSISRVSDQNGVSLLYIMLEIHHSGGEPSICTFVEMKKNSIKMSSSERSHWLHTPGPNVFLKVIC